MPNRHPHLELLFSGESVKDGIERLGGELEVARTFASSDSPIVRGLERDIAMLEAAPGGGRTYYRHTKDAHIIESGAVGEFIEWRTDSDGEPLVLVRWLYPKKPLGISGGWYHSSELEEVTDARGL
jgi:hypothetical protein